jgi:hypothetical protein
MVWQASSSVYVPLYILAPNPETPVNASGKLTPENQLLSQVAENETV